MPSPGLTYSGWKKSYTTLDGWNPINNGINHLSTGAGFLPSTVASFCHPLAQDALARQLALDRGRSAARSLRRMAVSSQSHQHLCGVLRPSGHWRTFLRHFDGMLGSTILKKPNVLHWVVKYYNLSSWIIMEHHGTSWIFVDLWNRREPWVLDFKMRNGWSTIKCYDEGNHIFSEVVVL